MWSDPPLTTVSNGLRTQKDIKMKLLYVFTAILAITLAEDNDSQQLDDLIAAESVELMKEGTNYHPAARSYNYIAPSQQPSQWNQQQNNPHNSWNQPQQQPIEPVNTYVPPPSPIITPQNDYVYQHHKYPQPTYPQPTYPQPTYPQPTYPQPTYPKPTYPKPTYPKPTSPQPTYPPTWSTTHHHPPTTTTPVAIIKNELYYGDNGSYKYEYQIADGTHVGEEGYFTDPKATDESLVKKGWYSYTGADGKVYTVTYWADKTGFHAYGDHLPTPPPVPAAIQAALDQKAKEEAEKNKPQTVYPQQVYYPTTQKPVYQTTQATYYPTQQVYYPQEQNYQSYGKK